MSTAFQKKEGVAPVETVEKISLLLLTILALLLIGCSKEGFYEGMYQGLQQREEVVHPDNDPFPPDQPSYDDYRREREEVLRSDEEQSL
jgi:hypothetical protein